MGLSIRNLEIL